MTTETTINEARQLARELRSGLLAIPVLKIADVLDGLCNVVELTTDDLLAERARSKALGEAYVKEN